MSLASLQLASLQQDHHRSFHAMPRMQKQGTTPERLSDVWPDFSTEISEAEIQVLVRKNRPAGVLREAVGAVVFSVGLVVGLMALLAVFGIR